MNNRGISITLVAVLIGAIIGIFTFVTSIFSTTARLVTIGFILFGISAVFVTNLATSTVTRQKIAVLVILLATGSLFAFGSGFLQQTFIPGGGEFIQVPLKGFYSCEPASIPITSAAITMTNFAGTNVKCPTNTDSCDFIIRAENDRLINSDVLTWKVTRSSGAVVQDTVNVIANTVKTISIPRMSTADTLTISVECGVFKASSKCDTSNERITFAPTFNPFVLFKTSPTTGKNEITTIARGCNFNAAESADLVVSDTLGIGTGTSTSISSLEPFKTRNFIDLIVPASVENFRIQPSGFCTDNRIFRIDEVKTVSASYRVINTDVVVASVECCSGEDVGPNAICQNNQLVSLIVDQETGQTDVECNLFNPCPGGEFAPLSSTSLQRFACVSGQCVQQTVNVECTINSACGGSKPICDQISNTCVIAPSPVIVGEPGETFGVSTGIIVLIIGIIIVVVLLFFLLRNPTPKPIAKPRVNTRRRR